MARIYIKLVLTALFWGGTFIAGRLAAQQANPWQGAFLRFALAGTCLFALSWRVQKRPVAIRLRDLPGLLALGATGVFLYNFLFFKGLHDITASRAALIIATCPVFIALPARLLFGEKLTPIRLAGMAISLLGAAIVIARGDPRELLAGRIGPGEWAILGCVACWAIYSLLGQALMNRITPLDCATWSSIFGAAGLLIPALATGLIHDATSFTTTTWLSIAFLALFGTVIGYVWFYQGVRAIGPTRAGQFINLVPLSGVLLGAAFLREPLTWPVLTGGLLVIAGVYLTNRPTRPATTIATAPTTLPSSISP